MSGRAAAPLAFRDAIGDWDHVETRLTSGECDDTPPLVTIAIPTYHRPALLAEAVRSALAQDFDRPFEIAIFDNEPTSRGWETLLAAVPEAAGRVRYHIHAENMGIFGNFNRAIRLARGTWMTMLMDDDLLDADYLTAMMAEVDHIGQVDGIVCHKRTLDERAVPSSRTLSLPIRVAQRILYKSRYWGADSRRVDGAKLFWWPGGIVGNPAGLLFRRASAVDIGGFYPENDMAADYWFYSRFVSRHRLRLHQATKATIRFAQNESTKHATQRGFIAQSYQVQQALAGKLVPGWWRCFSPLIIARQAAFSHEFWHHEIPRAEVEALLGIRLPPDRPIVYKALRLVFGGY